jgi:hypothetical protein
MSALSELEDCLYVVTNETAVEPASLCTKEVITKWRAAALAFESSSEGVWEQKFRKTTGEIFECMSKWVSELPATSIYWGNNPWFEGKVADLPGIYISDVPTGLSFASRNG